MAREQVDELKGRIAARPQFFGSIRFQQTFCRLTPEEQLEIVVWTNDRLPSEDKFLAYEAAYDCMVAVLVALDRYGVDHTADLPTDVQADLATRFELANALGSDLAQALDSWPGGP
jgi:hypothetical protein